MAQFRQQRISDQLRVELADLIQHEVRDPRVGFVTVTEVRASRDLNYARVYVSIFGDEDQTKESFEALERASGFLRSQVGRRLRLRHVPELRFTLDETLDNSERIDSLLDEAGAGGEDEGSTSLDDGASAHEHGAASDGGAPDSGSDAPDQAKMDEIIDVLRRHDDFIIAGHRDPDGDSLGSSLALALGLEQLGKRAEVLSADPLFTAYLRLPESERIVVSHEAPEGYPVAVLMECSDVARSGIEGLDGRLIVNIDHHANNPEFGDVNWVNPDVAAVGVMVYQLLEALGCEITKAIATHLYVAVLTDTGSFRYSNTDAEAFRVCAELVDCGVDPSVVAEAVYDNVPRDKIRLLAAGLASLIVDPDGRVASMALHHETLALSPGKPDTEGIVNQGQALEGVSVAALFKEVEAGQFRVSLRSDGSVDVAAIAASFGGGGHPRAAGCLVKGNLDEAKGVVLGAVREALDACAGAADGSDEGRSY